MFTGIIETTGTVKQIRHGEKSAILTISAPEIMDDVKVGDSIAVNGVCLTATSCDGDGFQADVMAETLRRSSLGTLGPGSLVNLERAMPMNGRFGGHMVSGHIDGTGTIVSMKREDNAVWVRTRCSKKILHYIIEKGSVAIDGISLTVASRDSGTFSVSVIPHTGMKTTLLSRKPGDVVNLENDIVGKYIGHFMQEKDTDSRILELLQV